MNFLGFGGGYQIKKASQGHDLIIVIHSDGHEVVDPRGFQEFGLLHSPANGWVFPDRPSTSILRWADPYGMPYEYSRSYVISRETPNPLEVPEIMNRAIPAAISRGSEGNINKELKLDNQGISAGDWFFYSMLGLFLVTFFFGAVLAPTPVINIDKAVLEQYLGGESGDESGPGDENTQGASGEETGVGGTQDTPGAPGSGSSSGAGDDTVNGAVIPEIVEPEESGVEAVGGEGLSGQGGP